MLEEITLLLFLTILFDFNLIYPPEKELIACLSGFFTESADSCSFSSWE